MATLAAIKDRIHSVSSIAKVTNAMQVVSAAQHQRLRARLRATQKYAECSWDVLRRLANAAGEEISGDPVFAGRTAVQSMALVVVTGDRGMAGDYYQAMAAQVRRFVQGQSAPVQLLVIGSHGGQVIRRLGESERIDLRLTPGIQVQEVSDLAQRLLAGYREGRFDAVQVAYARFLGGARFEPTIEQLLPLQIERQAPRQYIHEPGPRQALDGLLPTVLRFRLFASILESLAAETAARMMAMRTATRNAQELIERLRTSYNKARQQSITNEILDIIGGSSAVQQAGGQP